MKNQLFLDKIHQYVNAHGMISPGSIVLVGLSGGPDSVCLLHVLHKLKQSLNLMLIAAHVDHGWRSESEKEAQFCKELCDALEVRFISRKLSDLCTGVKNNGSREEYARQIRRQFFDTVAKECNAHVIALGHHADDHVETFFIRLIRGASLTGLVGIRPQQGLYIRPLLACNKKEIKEYLDRNNISYVTDMSNDSDLYLRNRIRNQLIPLFKSIDTRAYDNLCKSMHQLQQIESYLVEHTHQLWYQIALLQDNRWHVDIQQLCALPIAMRHRLLVHWFVIEGVPFVPTQRFLAEVEKFLSSNKNTQHAIHTVWTLSKKAQYIYIKKI